jgi:hypothetical protein
LPQIGHVTGRTMLAIFPRLQFARHPWLELFDDESELLEPLELESDFADELSLELDCLSASADFLYASLR